ncbi:hypothetical protein BDF14DRAFT_1839206 [Spinellus fusiger]|nr:hypothetical protein BDF14DRAFT_1839206 [Spinellus fusiger]
MNKESPFETLTLLRVLYMGSATSKEKQRIFHKLTDGLAQAMETHGRNASPHLFRERKYNLIMSTEAGHKETDTRAYEDSGVSMIEADYTWHSPAAEAVADAYALNHSILSYVAHHCDDPVAWISTAPLKAFDGFAYPEKTPNGIDLCVYFYNGSAMDTNTDASMDQLQDEFRTLLRIKRLKVPILPILTAPETSCFDFDFGSSSSPSYGNHKSGMALEERQRQLARLLSRFKIQSVNITSFETMEHPSFQRHSRSSPHSVVERPFLSPSPSLNANYSWAISGATLPEPYQILTVDQFVNIPQNVITELLTQTRHYAAQRQRTQDIIREKEQEQERHHTLLDQQHGHSIPSSSSSLSSLSSSSSSSILPPSNASFSICRGLWILLFGGMVAALLFFGPWTPKDFLFFFAQKPTQETLNAWSVSLHLAPSSDRSLDFHLQVHHNTHSEWLPVAPMATLSHTPLSVTRVEDHRGHYRFQIIKPLCEHTPPMYRAPLVVEVQVQVSPMTQVMGSPILLEALPCYQLPRGTDPRTDPKTDPRTDPKTESLSTPLISTPTRLFVQSSHVKSCPVAPTPVLSLSSPFPSSERSPQEPLSWSEWSQEALHVMHSIEFYLDNWRLLLGQV